MALSLLQFNFQLSYLEVFQLIRSIQLVQVVFKMSVGVLMFMIQIVDQLVQTLVLLLQLSVLIVDQLKKSSGDLVLLNHQVFHH